MIVEFLETWRRRTWKTPLETVCPYGRDVRRSMPSKIFTRFFQQVESVSPFRKRPSAGRVNGSIIYPSGIVGESGPLIRSGSQRDFVETTKSVSEGNEEARLAESSRCSLSTNRESVKADARVAGFARRRLAPEIERDSPVLTESERPGERLGPGPAVSRHISRRVGTTSRGNTTLQEAN